MATDLLFVMKPGAGPGDARQMVKELIAWAEKNPRVVEVHVGVTNAIVDWERTAKFYERLGLERCGAMFRREFDRSQKSVQAAGVSQ
jgi:GNAT superfamily N-acetyltransferase